MALGRIRRWAEKACGEPAEIVAILFAEIEAWAKQPGWTGTGFTRVAMELADMPRHPARLAASRHKAAVEQWLTAQFAAKHVHKPAACKPDGTGLLVLSSFAGAAAEMGEALLINPLDEERTALTVTRALAMTDEEKRDRMLALRERVIRNNVFGVG